MACAGQNSLHLKHEQQSWLLSGYTPCRFFTNTPIEHILMQIPQLVHRSGSTYTSKLMVVGALISMLCHIFQPCGMTWGRIIFPDELFTGSGIPFKKLKQWRFEIRTSLPGMPFIGNCPGTMHRTMETGGNNNLYIPIAKYISHLRRDLYY
jgi:hypothetical protein